MNACFLVLLTVRDMSPAGVSLCARLFILHHLSGDLGVLKGSKIMKVERFKSKKSKHILTGKQTYFHEEDKQTADVLILTLMDLSFKVNLSLCQLDFTSKKEHWKTFAEYFFLLSCLEYQLTQYGKIC